MSGCAIARTARKTSGGTGNTIVIVPRARFFWLTGEDHRVAYALRPTYTITRCKTCGTPLPAEEDEHNVYLTAGTLDEPLDAAIETHLLLRFARRLVAPRRRRRPLLRRAVRTAPRRS